MKKPKFIFGGSALCGDGCPTIYETKDEHYLVQGFKPSDTDIKDIDLPAGEDLIKLPKEFLEKFAKSFKPS